MLSNYLKIAFRHIWKNKGYSFINIMGLGIGIACFIMIILYVRDESGFDSFHEKGDRTYRVALDRKYPGRVRSYAIIPQSYAGAMLTEFPEVEQAVRLFYFAGNTVVLRVGDQTYEEPRNMWADSTFFEVFSIPLLKGDQKQALTKPNSVVLTESTAHKYFGTQDPIGRVLDLPNTEDDLVVSGVCADVPTNSHLAFDLLMSATALNFLQQPNYINFSAYTYLVLREGADYRALEAKFPQLVKKYAAGPIQREFSASYDEYVAAGNGYDYYLQPLPDIYLTSNLEGEIRAPGSVTRNYIFTIIALFILLIAVINFMNLATARATDRAKEVGIRKTLGSRPRQLVGQFLSEATLISLLSMFAALLLLTVLLPLFNDLSGKAFSMAQILQPKHIPLLLLFALAIGLLAGSYPAGVLSGFKPLDVLKGKLTATQHGALLRNGLVVFQFAISVVLIISTIVVFYQLQFIQNKALGFDKEQVITIQNGFQLQNQSEAFKKELNKLAAVESVGGCNSMPGGNFFGTSFLKEGDNETKFGSGIIVDNDFVECLNMEILEGRDFEEAYNDSLSLVINEAAVKELDLAAPVGKRISTTNVNPQTGQEETTFYTIIGVVKDFHFQSLHQVISPVYFFRNDAVQGIDNLITVRLEPGNIQGTVREIETLWHRFLPEQPFRFTFLDADLFALYQSEQVAQKIFGLFALLAIFIACMGLLGLAAYVTYQRTKEIGIRKILGASVTSIVGLLSKDFLLLVLISLVIAIPAAWYFMSNWLENFAYSVRLGWWIFVLAGLLALVIAFLTVSYQAIRAAFSNPIHALRDE